MEIQNKYIINVPIANIWTSYDSPRLIDKLTISIPTNIEWWLEQLTMKDRLELCEKNLLQTQVLYGQEVIVMEKRNGWSQIIIPDQVSEKNKRGYPGWIPTVQLIQQEAWMNEDVKKAVIKTPKAYLYTNTLKPNFELSYQTVLPIIDKHDTWIKVKIPDGNFGFLKRNDVEVFSNDKGNGDDIVAAGEQFLGLPYLWGGVSSFGYDCSGFSYTMHKANGYIIPRDADEQSKFGKEIKLTELKPGDLLFFAYDEGKGTIHHVGIYYGNGQLLHSPRTGKTVEVLKLAGTIYEKELCTARRYWKEMEDY